MSDDKLFARVGKTYSPGKMLFRDGDPGDAMYVIQDGRVRIFKEVRGEQKTLAYLGPGEFFGEMALLNGKPRAAAAEVVEETRMLVLDAKTFGAMIRNNGEIAARLIKRLAHRLDSANELVHVLMQRDPKARVVLALARAVEYEGERHPDGSAVIPLDPEGLAHQIGLSLDEVRAVIRRLYRLGVVDGSLEGLSIPNPEKLAELLSYLRAREGAVPA